MTLRDLVEKMCAAERWKNSVTTGGWELTVPMAKDRHQAVQAAAFKDGASDMVRYTSIVGNRSALDGKRSTSALEINARMPHGCLALDGENLVITATRPLNTTTAETSAQAIRYVAEMADRYERLIYGTDAH